MDSRVPSPWHEGEIALQRRLGLEDRMDEIGRRVMRDHLIEQHREFYPLLPMVVLGAVDEHGDAWATLRAGRPGFLSAPDAHRLTVALSRAATVGGPYRLRGNPALHASTKWILPLQCLQATFAPILKKENGRIDWTRTPREVHNQVRGLQPWPGAYTSPSRWA